MEKKTKIPFWFYVDFGKELSKMREACEEEGLSNEQVELIRNKYDKEEADYLGWLDVLNHHSTCSVETSQFIGCSYKIGVVKGNYRLKTTDVDTGPFYRECVPSGVRSIHGFGVLASESNSSFNHNGSASKSEEISLEYWIDNIKHMLVSGYNVKWGYTDEDSIVEGYILEKTLIQRNEAASVSLVNTKIREAIQLKYDSVPLNLFISTKSFGGHESFIIPGEPCETVNGEYLPKGSVPYLLRKNIIFKCARHGNYQYEYDRFLLITEGGILKSMSLNRCGYTSNLMLYPADSTTIAGERNQGVPVVFESTEIMNSLGRYSYCDGRDMIRLSENAIENANAVYHRTLRNNGVQWKCDKSTTDFTIGFEIEKEDQDMMNEYTHRKFFEETRWVKESDSSLSEEAGGYELVSPVFNLMDDSLEKDIEDFDSLKELINGTYNTVEVDEYNEDEYEDYSIGEMVQSCGGHINLGSKTYSPIQLFFGLKGFLPLMYSVYNLRIDKTYSKAEKCYSYLKDTEEGRDNHCTALQIKDHVIEFRIVAAVRNVKNLIWRRDLIRLMAMNINKSEQEVLRMMLNPRSLLCKHLKKVYRNDEKYMKKCNDFVRFAEVYNDVKLNPIDWTKFKGSSPDESDEDNQQ